MTMLTEFDLPMPDAEEITCRLAEIRKLATAGHAEPALLLAWAAMEAVARSAARDVFAKPQSPARIVETLAMEGYITPSEADRARELVAKRNRLVHGDLKVRASDREIEDFVDIIERLREFVPS